MQLQTVSVIIPTFKGAQFLGEAIQSVLNQSYPHFELIVVNDLSPDRTDQVVDQFDDSRIKYIVHEENLGAVAARRTGVWASSGEIIAFLDQDDWFHQDKLVTHVNYLQQHSEIGVTYNARFEYEQEFKVVRKIWQPPDSVTLAELVLGFPFSPSDTVLRRKLALRDDIWDQSYVNRYGEMIFNGAEIIFGGRLALTGVKFANVGKALNFRRYHPRRVFSDILKRCETEIFCQSMILDDPRCPDDIRSMRDTAYMNTYLYWSYYAFSQNETALGQSLLRKAVGLKPALVKGQPCELVKFMMYDSASDSSIEMEEHLVMIFDQLPPEFSSLSTQFGWAKSQGYLIKGTQAIIWDRPELGRKSFAKAVEEAAKINDSFIQNLTRQLLNHQMTFGDEATENIIKNLVPYLEQVDDRAGRRLMGSYFVNQAFRGYQNRKYAQVRRQVIQAITNDPKYLFNRGVLSILVRSTANLHSS